MKISHDCTLCKACWYQQACQAQETFLWPIPLTEDSKLQFGMRAASNAIAMKEAIVFVYHRALCSGQLWPLDGALDNTIFIGYSTTSAKIHLYTTKSLTVINNVLGAVGKDMALAVNGWHMRFHILDEPTDITVSKYSSVANFHSSSLKQNIALSSL